MSQSKIKPFLMQIAKGAGRKLMQYYYKSYQVEIKQNEGIVTEADKATENYLVKKILKEFPKSSIITEEAGKYEGSPDLQWIIDPLDGTTNFAHQFGYFCTSIGVKVDGKLKYGVIYQPLTGELFFAEKGKGAHLNGKRLKVSKVAHLKDSLLGTGFYYHTGKKLHQQIVRFERMSNLAQSIRRPGSAALDLAFVASGRYDGFWENGLNCWDVSAGFLLVTEAGGKLSNYQGKKTTIHEGEVVASNGKLHRQLIKVIQGK